MIINPGAEGSVWVLTATIPPRGYLREGFWGDAGAPDAAQINSMKIREEKKKKHRKQAFSSPISPLLASETPCAARQRHRAWHSPFIPLVTPTRSFEWL